MAVSSSPEDEPRDGFIPDVLKLSDTRGVISINNLSGIVCAHCGAGLKYINEHPACPACGRTYPVINGIVSLVGGYTSHQAYQESLWSTEARSASPSASSDRTLLFHLESERRFLARGRLPGGSVILDLGCGKGTIITLMGPGFFYRAVDISLESLFAARAFLREALPDTPIEYYHVDAETLPFAESTFDTVICFDILEHVEDKPAVLERTHRVLKREGLLFIHMPVTDSVFSLDWFYRLLFPTAHQANQKRVGHRADLMVDSRSMRRLLVEAGFEVVSLVKCDVFFVPLWDHIIMPRIHRALMALLRPILSPKKSVEKAEGKETAGRAPDEGRSIVFLSLKYVYLTGLASLSLLLRAMDALPAFFGIGAGIYALAKKTG